MDYLSVNIFISVSEKKAITHLVFPSPGTGVTRTVKILLKRDSYT